MINEATSAETGTLVPRLSSPGALSKSPGKERRSSASLGMRTIGRKKRDSDYFAVTDFCTVKSAQAKTRSEVNQLMTRELRLRDGCKNLLRAMDKSAKNGNQRAEIKAQLVSIHSNITTLHAQLQKINMQTALDCRPIVTADGNPSPFPLIALALKETIEADDLSENLAEFLEGHYHEKASKFHTEISTLCASRELMRTAPVTDEGRGRIQTYFGQLQQAEHRFFQEDKCGNCVFQWYDAFEGHPITKKSLKLEKASVLYNFAAVSTQLACMSDRNTSTGLKRAIKLLESAAGTLQYIREESSLKTSVSTDLSRSSLSTLSTLMLAQAQECIWYHAFRKGKDADPKWQPSGAEAAAVGEWFGSVRESFRQPLTSSMPQSWIDMVCIKEQYYAGIADWYTGVAEMAAESKMKNVAGIAKVYRAACTLSKCLKQWRASLRSDADFAELMEDHLTLAEQVLGHLDAEILEGVRGKIDRMPKVVGKAVRWATASCDEVLATSDNDMFARLGPVYFFNSMCALVERRSHTLTYHEEGGFGLTLSGGNPVRVSDVVYEGSASQEGILAGDYLIEIAGIDVRGMVTSEVEDVLAKHGTPGAQVSIDVVVNYDMQNFEELINPEIPTAFMQSPDKVTMPGNWNTLPSSRTGINLAGKRPLSFGDEVV